VLLFVLFAEDTGGGAWVALERFAVELFERGKAGSVPCAWSSRSASSGTEAVRGWSRRRKRPPNCRAAIAEVEEEAVWGISIPIEMPVARGSNWLPTKSRKPASSSPSPEAAAPCCVRSTLTCWR